MTTTPPDQPLGSLSVAIFAALSLVGCASPAEQRQAAVEREANYRQQRIDNAYDRCIGRVTGAFSSASIDVMRECERQSRNVK